MNAIDAGAEIHRARTERIAGATRHETRQIGLARDHFRRRMPVRPFRLAADGQHAGPRKTLAADADAVANGAALTEHIIKRGVAGIDDDRTGRFACVEGYDGAPQPFRDDACAAIAFIGQRGRDRRGHDVVRREPALRRGCDSRAPARRPRLRRLRATISMPRQKPARRPRATVSCGCLQMTVS